MPRANNNAPTTPEASDLAGEIPRDAETFLLLVKDVNIVETDAAEAHWPHSGSQVYLVRLTKPRRK